MDPLSKYDQAVAAERRAQHRSRREAGWPGLLTERLELVREEVDQLLEGLDELVMVLGEIREAAKFLDRDLAHGERVWKRLDRQRRLKGESSERESA